MHNFGLERVAGILTYAVVICKDLHAHSKKKPNLPHKEENKLSEIRKQMSTFFKRFEEIHSVEMHKVCIGLTQSYSQVPAETNPNT